jgi:hypothetical protein
MLLWVYLCGSLVAAAGSSVAADLLAEPDVPAATRTKVIVFAGVAWPVLLVGLLQLICIGGLARTVSADPQCISVFSHTSRAHRAGTDRAVQHSAAPAGSWRRR